MNSVSIEVLWQSSEYCKSSLWDLLHCFQQLVAFKMLRIFVQILAKWKPLKMQQWTPHNTLQEELKSTVNEARSFLLRFLLLEATKSLLLEATHKQRYLMRDEGSPHNTQHWPNSPFCWINPSITAITENSY